MKKLINVAGVIDRIDDGIVIVLRDEGAGEIALESAGLADARPGARFAGLVSCDERPGAVGRVLAAPRRARVKPMRLPSFSGLVRQLDKVRGRLVARRDELLAPGAADEPPTVAEEIDALDRRIAWIDEGFTLFRK